MKPGPGREVAYRMAGSVGYAYRQVEAPTGEKKERLLDAGENPPGGVVVHYFLKEAPAGDVTLTFLDAKGREIRSFTGRREAAPDGAPTAAARAGCHGRRGAGTHGGPIRTRRREEEPRPTQARRRQSLRLEPARAATPPSCPTTARAAPRRC